MKFVELFDNDMKPKWDIIENIPQFAALKTTKQSNTWHLEGDALRHTQLVVENMQRELDEQNIDNHSAYYLIMMSAALCHDLGKATSTKWDKEKNDYVCNHHGQAGENITRMLFYDEKFIIRELVCYMVRWHMNLHHILDDEEKVDEKLINMAHGWVSIQDMLLLNKCDSLGSQNDIETREFLENRWDTIKERAEKLDVFDMVYDDYNTKHICENLNTALNASNPIAPFSFMTLNWRDVRESCSNILRHTPINWKTNNIKILNLFTVFMMIGIPGSGKDTIIQKYLNDIPTVCRDDIRTEIGIQGEKPMGNKEQEKKVTQIFEERMLEYCKQGKSFVINNTNLKKQYRNRFLDIIKPYKPVVIYIYVEAPSIVDNFARRAGQIDQDIIRRMASNFDFPYPTEYTTLWLDIQGEPQFTEIYGNAMMSHIIRDIMQIRKKKDEQEH